jgi:hypothetical protein
MRMTGIVVIVELISMILNVTVSIVFIVAMIAFKSFRAMVFNMLRLVAFVDGSVDNVGRFERTVHFESVIFI